MAKRGGFKSGFSPDPIERKELAQWRAAQVQIKPLSNQDLQSLSGCEPNAPQSMLTRLREMTSTFVQCLPGTALGR